MNGSLKMGGLLLVMYVVGEKKKKNLYINVLVLYKYLCINEK